MEQFSPNKSRVFAVAAFANFYSSGLVRSIRTALGGLLILILLISVTSGINNLLYLASALAIIFCLFEIFYRDKVLKEKPQLLTTGRELNLADFFSLEAARFILKNPRLGSFKDLFSSLLKNREVLFVLARADFTQNDLAKVLSESTSPQQITFSEIALSAKTWAAKENRKVIDILDIFLAATSKAPALQKLFFDKQIKEADILNIVFWSRAMLEATSPPLWERSVESLGPGISNFWTGGWTLETETFAFDITEQLQKGKLAAFLVGRDKEITQIEEVLARSEKRNVIILGEPGIGKRSIVYGLAEKSLRGVLPPALEYKRFLELDVTALTAKAASGELESRIQNLITEISHAENVVLFVPEIENLAGSSGTGVNVTGHLLNALGSGRLQVIATSTRQAYRRYIETQGTFAAAFEIVNIEEPSKEGTIRILEEAAPKIELKNKVAVTYKAIQTAVELAEKYLVDRVLPGKAIDLLDEAATAASLKKKSLLESTDIEELISQKTKIPVREATGKEAEKLIHLEEILHRRIVDQEEAIVAISNALRRARTITRETKKPIGSFLFLGPTGVGKTETAKALAAFYFGSEEKIIRVDMSEFQEASSINRLIGAPPGTGEFEDGGEFTEKVRTDPYALVLLDEMEKANAKVQEAFLPIFDEGIAEDATGRKIIFTNTIIITTSNAGAEFIRESIQQGVSLDNLKRALLEKLQREGTFKPEFLNRFDDIIVYKPLSVEEVAQVVNLMISELASRLKKQDVYLTIDPTVFPWIAKVAYDPTYGARPLRRYIADHLEEKIAEQLLSGGIKRGSQIKVRIENNQLVMGI